MCEVNCGVDPWRVKRLEVEEEGEELSRIKRKMQERTWWKDGKLETQQYGVGGRSEELDWSGAGWLARSLDRTQPQLSVTTRAGVLGVLRSDSGR